MGAFKTSLLIVAVWEIVWDFTAILFDCQLKIVDFGGTIDFDRIISFDSISKISKIEYPNC